ncbi:MAG: hypothetical protein NUV77_18615, partial [Thermoguttaceae bacterium]|nr:hypothetical protein [Thermoguttaceae bacterium]
MTTARNPHGLSEDDFEEATDRVPFDFELSRRGFVRTLGAGLLVTAYAKAATAQRKAGRAGGGRGRSIAARIHLGADGAITVLSGKVEMGQGARAE